MFVTCAWLCLHAHLLRNQEAAQPPSGILSAEAACQISKYIMNFINRIEGSWSVQPLRHIEEPVHLYYEYDSFSDRIVTRSTGAAVATELGPGSDLGLDAPTGVGSLDVSDIKKRLARSTGSSAKKRRSSSSGTSKRMMDVRR